MEAWQEKIIEEKNHLGEKMAELELFMTTDFFRHAMEEYDKFLLCNQYFYMTSYNAVLEKLIARF